MIRTRTVVNLIPGTGRACRSLCFRLFIGMGRGLAQSKKEPDCPIKFGQSLPRRMTLSLGPFDPVDAAGRRGRGDTYSLIWYLKRYDDVLNH